MDLKVISGGQTGIDELSLELAHKYGIPTGGTAPLGYRTDIGQNLDLKNIYGLDEHQSYEYGPRTACNVAEAKITVLFGDMSSPGCKLTIALCEKYGKLYLINPDISDTIWAVCSFPIVNFAGNRRKNLTHAQWLKARITIETAFKFYKIL